MKYRKGFVTNSSSTNFGAAGASALLGLLISLLGSGEGSSSSNAPDQQILGTIRTAKMPSNAKLIQGTEDPVFLYAQFYINTEKGDVLSPEVTSNIEFSVLSGSNWVSLGNKVMVEDWAAIDLYPSNSEIDEKPPTKVTIAAEVKYLGRKYRKKINIPFESKPEIVMKPDTVSFLSKTGDTAEIKLSISSSMNKNWEFSINLDDTAEKICKCDLEIKSKLGDKAVLTVTENDTIEGTNKLTSYYDTGKISVIAKSGDIEIEDYLNVKVYREGLYISSGLNKETGYCVVKGDKNEKNEMLVTELDLVYLVWDNESKRLVSKSEVLNENLELGDPDCEGELSQNVFDGCGLEINYDRIRPSNISSAVYKLNTSLVIPGKKGEFYRASIPASVQDGDKYFGVSIPVELRPAYLSEAENWQKEYENCKKIIYDFMPADAKLKKIQELESSKYLFGVEDLRRFRHECWDIVYKAFVQEQKKYEDLETWYNNAIYYCEWAQWVGDRAFSLVVGSLTGPLGSYTVSLIKDSLLEFINQVITSHPDNVFDFALEYTSSRFWGTTGSTIDAVVTNEPSMSSKWVIGFFIYKFAWHLYFDKDDNGNRKGIWEAVKSTAFDFTALGIEKKLEKYIGESATKKGWSKNEKFDEWVKKQAEMAKFAIDYFKNAD